MTTQPDSLTTADTGAPVRRSVYALLIMLSTGAMLGRIAAVQSVDTLALERYRMDQIATQLEEKRTRLQATEGWTEDRIERELAATEERLRQHARLNRPGLSANDRSRWCTLRALVEEDMRVTREVTIDGKRYIKTVPYAIDHVQNEKGWDTIDMVKHGLPSDPSGRGYLYSSKPTLLPTLMAVPYWAIYQATGASLETHPFVVTRALLILLNVLPLVFCLFLLSRLVERFGTTDWGRYFIMAAAAFGTFLTTFSVTLNNHIPGAVSVFCALYAAIRIGMDGRRELRYFVVAGAGAAFGVACELPALAFFAALSVGLLWRAPRQTLLAYVPAALLVGAAFFGTNWVAHESLRPPYAHRGEGDNWYDYSFERGGRERDSYWRQRVGIDRGEPSRATYALHVLVGHHGVFSLTPIWLLTVAGLCAWLIRPPDRQLREVALLIASVSAVCLLFYLTRPQDDRNYGGMTSAFRWMFWFAPMWLLAMAPVVDWMSKHRLARAVALVLLVASVLSASYPIWNPWTQPWIYNALLSLGWQPAT